MIGPAQPGFVAVNVTVVVGPAAPVKASVSWTNCCAPAGGAPASGANEKSMDAAPAVTDTIFGSVAEHGADIAGKPERKNVSRYGCPAVVATACETPPATSWLRSSDCTPPWTGYPPANVLVVRSTPPDGDDATVQPVIVVAPAPNVEKFPAGTVGVSKPQFCTRFPPTLQSGKVVVVVDAVVVVVGVIVV